MWSHARPQVGSHTRHTQLVVGPHNASRMRVQSYALKDMKPGNKQEALIRLRTMVVVLVIGEVSIVGALLLNMLSHRSTCGRSIVHCVAPGTYMDGPDSHPSRMPSGDALTLEGASWGSKGEMMGVAARKSEWET